MRSKGVRAREVVTGFDEVLVYFAPLQKPWGEIPLQFSRWLGMAMFVGGALLFLCLLAWCIAMACTHCGQAGWVQLLGLGESKGISGAADLLSPFGSSGQVAVNLMATGAVLYSFSYLAGQVREARDARIQQEMPVVFVAPKLKWKFEADAEGHVRAKELVLDVRVRNVGGAAATRVQLRLEAITYGECTIDAEGIGCHYLDYLPPQEDRRTEANWSSYHPVVVIDLTPHCPELLHRILTKSGPVLPGPSRDGFDAIADEPTLRLALSASFWTVRRARFATNACVRWSPRCCRLVGMPHQPKILADFSLALAQKAALDRFLNSAEDYPLSPMVTRNEPVLDLGWPASTDY